MKLFKRNFFTVFIFMFSIFLVSCASKNASSVSNDSASNNADITDGKFSFGMGDGKESAPQDTAGKNESTSESVETNRKLIQRISMYLETLEFDFFTDLIRTEIETKGGYIESSSIDGKGYIDNRSRYASYVIRIPKDQVSDFINTIGENSNVITKEESVEDITLAYVDTESRLRSLEIQQERLLALLEKSERLEDIIALESRLNEVRYELELHGKTLRTYDNLVEYATVTLRIHEVVRMTPGKPIGVWDRISQGLKETVYTIYKGFTNFFVWIVVNGLYIIIWGGILFLIGFIAVRVQRKLYSANAKVNSKIPEKEKREDTKKDS